MILLFCYFLCIYLYVYIWVVCMLNWEKMCSNEGLNHESIITTYTFSSPSPCYITIIKHFNELLFMFLNASYIWLHLMVVFRTGYICWWCPELVTFVGGVQDWLHLLVVGVYSHWGKELSEGRLSSWSLVHQWVYPNIGLDFLH